MFDGVWNWCQGTKVQQKSKRFKLLSEFLHEKYIENPISFNHKSFRVQKIPAGRKFVRNFAPQHENCFAVSSPRHFFGLLVDECKGCFNLHQNGSVWYELPSICYQAGHCLFITVVCLEREVQHFAKKTRLLVKGRKINLPQQLQPELSRGDRNVKSHAEMIQHQLFLNRHNCSQILHCKGWSSHTFAFQCSCKKLHTVHTWLAKQQTKHQKLYLIWILRSLFWME